MLTLRGLSRPVLCHNDVFVTSQLLMIRTIRDSAVDGANFPFFSAEPNNTFVTALITVNGPIVLTTLCYKATVRRMMAFCTQQTHLHLEYNAA